MSRSEPVDPTVSPWHLLGAAMRHWREDVRGLSLRDVAAKTYVDPGDLSKWERGLARPQADTVGRIDAHLGANNQLVALQSTICDLDRLRRRVTVRDRTPTQDEDDVERRTLLHLLSAFGATTALPPGTVDTVFAGVKRSLDDRLDNDLDDWEQAAGEYAQVIWTALPGALITDLAADLLQIGRLLDRDLPGPIRNGLMRVSAQLGVYMAIELADTGNPRSAWRAWRTARRAADTSGDLGLAVWVRGREVSRAYCEGRPVAATNALLDDVIRLAGDRPYLGLEAAFATRARILASHGEATQARSAVNQLTELYDRLPDPAVGDHLTSFGAPDGYLWFGQGYAFALLGDVRRTSQAVENGLAVTSEERQGAKINLQLIQALALVRGGDTAQGLQHALAAAQGFPTSAPRRRLLGEIVNSIPDQGRSTPAVHHLRGLMST
ncbi:helix-turn-helix transcriptional regulator [Thermopolyspora sp. NPDC052614]|uniref:helix-turn-helix domain-containing protein n=1 Tax=Thermopolyspora sp. NPDC052614 TaxID=3155682 RepID=UPI00343D14F7